MVSPMSSWGALLRRGHLGTQADRATFRTLHTALLASPPLRQGLNPASAERSLKHLRTLLGAPGRPRCPGGLGAAARPTNSWVTPYA